MVYVLYMVEAVSEPHAVQLMTFTTYSVEPIKFCLNFVLIHW